MAGELEEKSIDEVCQWLEDGGFPDSILQTFRGTASYAVDIYSKYSLCYFSQYRARHGR